MTREEEAWRPREAPRPWRSIVIHHTATKTGSVESIDQAHRRKRDGRGNLWLGIGYHFVIGNGQGMRDGEIAPTFRWARQLHGAHAGSTEHNETGIGIVLVGNFEQAKPTAAQWAAVQRLTRHLTSRYEIPAERIVGHGELKATACPGRYFPLADLQAGVAVP